IRLGDHVEIEGQMGVVEEIGLTYTFIRVEDNDRLVIPNERIASDTIRNSSIRGPRKLAQVTVQVPLDSDLEAVTGLLREAAEDERAEVVVSALEDKAQVIVSVWADDEPAADRPLLGSIPAEKNRTRVGLHGVSIWERRATVAIEDHRFYEHGGVDYQGIIRAAVSDLRAGHVVQGGSTIAQQLVRNLYISKERTFKRKINEACLAIKLSRRWSKDRILAEYMNQVYYGNHAYGIEAAAETYFSKHARNLWLAQAAMLAGLPQAPSVYDPFHRPAAALARRDEVLRAMLQYGAITPAQYREAVAQRNLHLRAGRLYTQIKEPYFFSYVRDQLIAEYGANTVRTGGLRV